MKSSVFNICLNTHVKSLYHETIDTTTQRIKTNGLIKLKMVELVTILLNRISTHYKNKS